MTHAIIIGVIKNYKFENKTKISGKEIVKNNLLFKIKNNNFSEICF